jgi:hypothetical protein
MGMSFTAVHKGVASKKSTALSMCRREFRPDEEAGGSVGGNS